MGISEGIELNGWDWMDGVRCCFGGLRAVV